MSGTPYTKRQLNWLRKHYLLMPAKDLTAAFNAKYGQSRTDDAIKGILFREGIRCGRTGHFEKGAAVWNKGKKGYMGANVTSFKSGNVPPNRKSLWTERIDSKDGFILIKVPERNPHTGCSTRYKHKHVWVWEQANGPVPKGYAVVFKDSNKLNCELDNLMLLTRSELLSINLHGYKDMPEVLKPAVMTIAKIETKAGFRLCPGRGRRPDCGKEVMQLSKDALLNMCVTPHQSLLANPCRLL